jgi:two-component system response regulator RegX3
VREKMTKVMVVDDEPDLREMVGILINKEGFETDLAKDGSDFLEKIDSFNPDIVTLDVMMPGLTTSEILKKLKEKKSNPKIILLTVVRYSEEEKRKIFEMGNIVDYVTKPFELDDFMDAVKKHV